MKLFLAITILLFSTQLFGQSNNQDEVYDVVDVIPEYPSGGMEGFYEFVHENLTYPEKAKSEGIEGRVFIRFVVTKEGEITQEQVVKGVHAQLDKEALRVLKMSPNWTPGQLTEGGPFCSVRMILPFVFRIRTQEEVEDQAKNESK